MKHHAIGAAVVLAMLPATGAFAAGLDRSGQPVAPIFQPGNLVELGWTSIFPTVEGKESIGVKRDISNMADKYSFPSAAVKYQANDQWSFSFLYDHPFGADAAYSGVNLFTVGKGDTSASSTGASVTTQSFSLIAGFQPNKNWHLYGGPVYQTIKGDVQLRGMAYSVFSGYDATFRNSGGWGGLAGVAYQIPEIAFRAALTYRSAISHDVDTVEKLPFAGADNVKSSTRIKTPQSVNLDLQSGIAPDTVAFANLRWVDWSSFSIRPDVFGKTSQKIGQLVGKPNGFNLVEYGKDQYSATVGVGRKFSDQWAGNMSVGWDSGTGEYVTTLGPTRGNWNLGIGAQYSPTKNFYIGLGAKYFWLGDAKAQVASNVGTTTYQADFKDNNAVAVGVKVGYRF